jgi:hypothetical protein
MRPGRGLCVGPTPRHGEVAALRGARAPRAEDADRLRSRRDRRRWPRARGHAGGRRLGSVPARRRARDDAPDRRARWRGISPARNAGVAQREDRRASHRRVAAGALRSVQLSPGGAAGSAGALAAPRAGAGRARQRLVRGRRRPVARRRGPHRRRRRGAAARSSGAALRLPGGGARWSRDGDYERGGQRDRAARRKAGDGAAGRGDRRAAGARARALRPQGCWSDW